MTVKWYATRFVDRLVPGQEIPEGTYDDDQLQQMLVNRLARREIIDDPKAAPAKQTAKKAASKKSASSK